MRSALDSRAIPCPATGQIYHKKRLLFNELSLALNPGNIYGLLGRNGAGKTSLLRILAGQLFRAAGLCSVLGSDPGNRDPGMLADIYYLPEEYYVPAVKPHEYISMYSPFYPLFSCPRIKSYLSTRTVKKRSFLSHLRLPADVPSFSLTSRPTVWTFHPRANSDVWSRHRYPIIRPMSSAHTKYATWRI